MVLKTSVRLVPVGPPSVTRSTYMTTSPGSGLGQGKAIFSRFTENFPGLLRKLAF